MGVKFSIIIPSFNKASPLRLTLTSLELQKFPKGGFEVIVVNDGSDDGTDEAMKAYRPPYPFIYIGNDARNGRAYTRNAGAKRAQGEYLVFLDADFLVVPEFLKVLHKYHRRHPGCIISGFPGSLNAVFAQYDPNFSARKLKNMKRILKPHRLWNDAWTSKKQMADVLTSSDLRSNFAKLRSVVRPLQLSESESREYKSTDVAPWLLFVTRCVSVKRKAFMEEGGFDERFIKYGLEDLELGYRLHRRGLSFRSMNEIVGYHQEHPSISRVEDPKLNNLRIFYDIHGTKDPELSLLAVCHPWKNLSLYKSLLRTLSKWRKTDDEYMQLGGIVEKALRQAAEAFRRGKHT